MIVPNRLVARFFVLDLLNKLSYMSCLAALWKPRKQGFMTGRVFCVSLSRQVVDCEQTDPVQPRPQASWRFRSAEQIFSTSLTGDVKSEIAEDGWERGWALFFLAREAKFAREKMAMRSTLEQGALKFQCHQRCRKRRDCSQTRQITFCPVFFYV